jgi:hypothetical protein
VNWQIIGSPPDRLRNSDMERKSVVKSESVVNDAIISPVCPIDFEKAFCSLGSVTNAPRVLNFAHFGILLGSSGPKANSDFRLRSCLASEKTDA